MKLPLFARLTCAVVALAMLSITSLQAQSVGDQAPTLVLPNQNDQNAALSDLKGNYVYLHFWASWCNNSMDQLPIIAQIHQHYKDHNFKMYSVSMDASRDAWLNAINTYQLNWPQHHCDFNGPFSKNLRAYKSVIGTPFGFLIDPNGVVLERDPNIHDYETWFKSDPNAASGNYYTVHLGAFPNFDYVDFDYIEEIATVESGIEEDGSYYIHIGKYGNRPEAEQALMKALRKGYYDATIVTESYIGNGAALSHIQPSIRAQKAGESLYFDYTTPEKNSNLTQPNGADTYYAPYTNSTTPSPTPHPSEFNNADTYYAPYTNTTTPSSTPPSSEFNNTDTYYAPYTTTTPPQPNNNQSGATYNYNTVTPPPTNNHNPPTTESLFDNNAIIKIPQEETNPQPQFYTSRSNTNKTTNTPSTTPKQNFTLPEPTPNPSSVTETDQDVPNSLSRLKKEQDFFNNPNPFIGKTKQQQPSTSNYNFENKWHTPQTTPESIMDPAIQKELEKSDASSEQPYDNNYNFDPNSAVYNSYTNDDPTQGIYLNESKSDPLATSNSGLKESKYERKLRMKKKKLKRKQEKLRRQIEENREELEGIDTGIEFSSQYRE